MTCNITRTSASLTAFSSCSSRLPGTLPSGSGGREEMSCMWLSYRMHPGRADCMVECCDARQYAILRCTVLQHQEFGSPFSLFSPRLEWLQMPRIKEDPTKPAWSDQCVGILTGWDSGIRLARERPQPGCRFEETACVAFARGEPLASLYPRYQLLRLGEWSLAGHMSGSPSPFSVYEECLLLVSAAIRFPEFLYSYIEKAPVYPS
ncbi:hypothetical protein CC79DRAFT_200277 [Sarocladium strictum]